MTTTTLNLINMKKKYRNAVQIAIFMAIAMITAPISLLGMIGEGLRWLWDYTVLKPMYWYVDKFIINDNDPDCPCHEKGEDYPRLTDKPKE